MCHAMHQDVRILLLEITVHDFMQKIDHLGWHNFFKAMYDIFKKLMNTQDLSGRTMVTEQASRLQDYGLEANNEKLTVLVQRDRSIRIDVKPSIKINRFNITEGLTSAEHALSVCILQSL